MACVMGEIDLVSALGHAGIPCAVVAIKGDPATYSRHARDQLAWYDPWEESEVMLASLIDWARRQSERPVLFFNGDHDLLLVSRNRTRLAALFDFVIAEGELVEDLVDKDRFMTLARRLHLPVPATIAFETKATSPEAIELDFPIIVKPLTRRESTWRQVSGGSKALRFDDRKELERAWEHLAGQGRVLAQTLIVGPEARIESYHVYIAPDGEPLCEFTGRKIRTLPEAFGDTTALKTTDSEDVRSLGRDVTEALTLTGVAKLDFKRDNAGRLWLLEVNPRFNLWNHVGAVAGANIPAAVYANLTGRQRVPTCAPRPGVTWCHPTRDARAAHRSGIGYLTWARWAIRCDARWALSVRDPMPFVRGVLVRRMRSRFGRP